MEAIYPSKSFLTLTRDTFVKREDHIMIITNHWRRRIIAKEISKWAKSLEHADQIARGKSKGFPLCMVLMPSLMSMHHFAIAHDYLMSFHITDSTIEIIYTFRNKNKANLNFHHHISQGFTQT